MIDPCLSSQYNSIGSSTVPIVAVSVPLSDSNSTTVPGGTKVVYHTTFTASTPALVHAVKSGLSSGVVEIDVQSDLSEDANWEALEEFLGSVLADRDPEATKPAIVLCESTQPSSRPF